MVTAVVNNKGLVAGMVLDWTSAETSLGFKTTGVLTRGNLLCRDASATPDGWKVTPASAAVYGPFAMCMTTCASGDTGVSVIEGGTVALVADGTIEVGEPVQAASSTAGQVIAFAATNIATTLADTGIETAILDSQRIAGQCLGFADNYHTVAPTAPVDGDLAAIRLKKGV